MRNVLCLLAIGSLLVGAVFFPNEAAMVLDQTATVLKAFTGVK